MQEKKLIIIGIGEFGGIAYHYFSEHSDYQVIGFAVEEKYYDKQELFGIPVVKFEEIEQKFPAAQVEVFVAITNVNMNKERTRIYKKCKDKGYRCASFIHPSSYVGHGVSIGENVFVFEQVSIQYYSDVADNCIIWEGTKISHRSHIEPNCWIAPGVTLAGFCNIGENCFLGVGSVCKDGICLTDETMVGAGAVVVKDVDCAGGIYVGNPARYLKNID